MHKNVSTWNRKHNSNESEGKGKKMRAYIKISQPPAVETNSEVKEKKVDTKKKDCCTKMNKRFLKNDKINGRPLKTCTTIMASEATE